MALIPVSSRLLRTGDLEKRKTLFSRLLPHSALELATGANSLLTIFSILSSSLRTDIKMLLKLKSSDHKSFTIEQSVARTSTLFRELIENTPNTPPSNDDGSFLCNVEGDVLAMVIKWMEHHAGEKEIEEDDEANFKEKELEEWDKDFFKLEYAVLCDLMIAASYLDIKNLLFYTAKAVALQLEGKSTEEMREYTGEENDFPEEVPADSSQKTDGGDEKKEEEGDQKNKEEESSTEDEDDDEDEDEDIDTDMSSDD